MKKLSFVVIFLSVLALVLISLVGCGEKEESPTPLPTQTPTPTPSGWFWKSGGFIDYALNGIPDFDQKQDQWKSSRGTWSYCGPVALANSLWWFDSKFEPSPVAPPTINDNYALVRSYNQANVQPETTLGPGVPPEQLTPWDDHDTHNVAPLVQDLALRMDTDGQASGRQFFGTYVHDMENAIDQYLKDKALDNAFYEVTVKSPEFGWIVEEVKRSEDVILLLGFWEWQEQYQRWARIGGHYVTVAGVNPTSSQIAISDPYLDNAEANGSGRVLPAKHAYPHDSSVHNDTGNVSHDIYKVVSSDSPGGPWALESYPATPELLENFLETNFAEDQYIFYHGAYTGGPVQTEIDYAVAVSPGTAPTPTPTPTPTLLPTPSPTPTPPPPPPPTPSPSPTLPASPTPTATTTPTATPSPTASPSPTPPVPDPSVPVVTGVSTKHRVDPASGVLIVDIHCLSTHFPNGTNIYDMHFFTESGQYIGSLYFDEPLVPCTQYSFPVEGFDGTVAPESITIYLTDENHKIWGQTTSQNF